MGLAPYGEPKYVDLILTEADRPEGGRLVPAQHGLFRLLRGSDDDQRKIRPAVRRCRRAGPRSMLTQRDMDLRPFDPGRDRGDHAPHGPHVHAGDGHEEPLPGRRRGPELRRQRADPPGRALRKSGSSPRPAMPAGRWARPFSPGTSIWATARGRRSEDGMRGSYLGPAWDRAAPGVPEGKIGVAYTELNEEEIPGPDRRPDRRGERHRLVPGADGVRPAGARRPLHHRRRALAEDAVGHEPEDQVPRELPPVRPRGPERAGGGVLSISTGTAPTCCWWRR